MQSCAHDKIEILAPAGDLETLCCAVNNGADAVYLGVGAYNARAKATNFSFEELARAVEYAHFFGVKIYATFNILYKPEEYDDVLSCIKKCHELGVDAFILQDFALILLINSTMPDIVIHLSTQAGVHNALGAIAAEKLGVKRVVLSRETLLADIIEIKEKTNLEIEFFVQGALCIGFSGNCYFSSLVSGYSGNRGKCLQLCRKKYTFKNKSAYWLSPKDINMSKSVKRLIYAGVTSFKIEGRMRRPEYVGEAINCYKRILSGLSYDQSNLKRMFNRGNYTDVYISDVMNNVVYPYAQNHIGDKIGNVLRISNKTAYLNTKVNKGDGLKFFRGNIEVGHSLVPKDDTKTTFVGEVKAGDEIRITTDARLNAEVARRMRYNDVTLTATIAQQQAIFVCKSVNSVAKIVKTDLQPAKNCDLTKDDVIKCFEKTDEFGFRLCASDIEIKDKIFMAKSELNEIRRSLYKQLHENIIHDYVVAKNDSVSTDIFAGVKNFVCDEKCTIFQTDSVESANICSDLYDYVAFFPKKWDESLVLDLKNLKKPFLLVLPSILRGNDVKEVQKVLDLPIVERVIVNNLYGLEMAKDKQILMGTFMNFINDKIDCEKICSVESKNYNKQNFVYYYGNYPIMTYCHCPLRSYYGKCVQCNNNFVDKLYDEKGNEFSFYSYKVHYCYCYLLNNVAINLTGAKVNTQRKFVDLVGVETKTCYNILKDISDNKKISGGTSAYYNKVLE